MINTFWNKSKKRHPNRLANYTTILNGMDNDFILKIKSDRVENWIDEYFNDHRYEINAFLYK